MNELEQGHRQYTSGVLSGAIGAATYTRPPSPLDQPPAPPVDSSLERLRKSLALAHDRIGLLENRLRPVLRPTPQVAQTGGQGDASGSPLVNSLNELRACADSLAVRLNDLIDTCDL